MNSLILAGLLKRIYNKFDMSNFSDRLKLQKIIYLLQANRIYLGYNFNRYIYGPYCPDLAKDGFNIEDQFSQVQKVGFEDSKLEEKFKEFIKYIDKYKDNTEWLEISSSIHLFKRLYPKDNKKETINRIVNKREKLKNKEQDIIKVWNDINGWIM